MVVCTWDTWNHQGNCREYHKKYKAINRGHQSTAVLNSNTKWIEFRIQIWNDLYVIF